MVRVVGNATALLPLSREEVEEMLICKEVIWSVFSNLPKHDFETSAHAHAGAGLAERLRFEKLQARKDADSERAVEVDLPQPEMHVHAAIELLPIEDAVLLAKEHEVMYYSISRLLELRPDLGEIQDTNVKAGKKIKSTRPFVLSAAAASFVPGKKYAPKPVETDSNDDRTSNKSASGSESATGKESLASRPKSARSQGVASPSDFMKEFHKLRKLKELAAKAAAAGAVRRVIFGDLPEWGTIPNILQLVYGGNIERVWTEDGQVIVQWVDKAACEKYYENHSDGIEYFTAGGERATISVTLPEDGLTENAHLAARVAEGASRVVRLAGLPTGHTDSDNNSFMGIVSKPGWSDKKFEQVLIVPAESGVDVVVSFYDLHDGWEFFQDIKEGLYDCIPVFDTDPCARAKEFHFMEEPCVVFNAVGMAM